MENEIKELIEAIKSDYIKWKAKICAIDGTDFRP